MFHSGLFSFHFCVVAIICMSVLCAEGFHAMANNCVETDRQALLRFKDALVHEKDDLLTSWKGEECCKWEGISCDNLTSHVTRLNFNAFGLRGKLDSSICELQHLNYLNFRDNLLEGKIPNCIGSLRELIELDLSGNNLVSVIPSTLGNLSNLQTLDLSNVQTVESGSNYLIANDLEWISRLSNLRYLDLSLVNLSRAVDWLSSISKISSLSELALANCKLITPKSIPHMNSSTPLKSLYLNGNSLNSSILPWVINVSKVLTNLDLSFNSLQQSLPYDFGKMIFLQYLDLSNNELQGSLPKSFKSMCQLQELKLNSNKLSSKLSDNIQQLCCAKNSTLENLDMSDNVFASGSLPDVSCFSKLTTLYLRNTTVIGSLPKSFVHLPSLQSLDLSRNQLNSVDIIDDAYLSAISMLDLSFNQLNGSLPLLEITKLASLETLDLSYNKLSGSFPHTIARLSNLRVLFLSSNKLNGVINEAIVSNLSQLNVLNVNQNSLSFNLSSDWVPPFKLETLYASSCTLGPKFPEWLKHHKELVNLEISNTGISDSLPEWFRNFTTNLKYLNVSHNKLNGPLPKSFPSAKVDEMNVVYEYTWDFSFNNLNGSLPQFPQPRSLFLSNNMFTGSLSFFCTSPAHDLNFLDLSSNLLAGQLLDCWGKFEVLIVLNLANNNFSGKVPNSFGTLQYLEWLHLNNNNFSGEIPSLILCTSLEIVDVGNNNLQGTLPVWIGHLHNLIVLRLRVNKFQGNIPTSICNLSFLQVLDLSINNVTGEIPQCFGNILTLSNLMFPRKSFHYYSETSDYTGREENEYGSYNDKATLALKGSNREYERNLGLITTIDLSCNQLTGEIPQSITKLVALVGLNLSWNNLTGFIPSNIGHMQMLESLDLSRNRLYGKMPTSFSNLTFLSYMNLSYNNLESKIPLSTQLQSFDPSSFVGNDRLCGPPLVSLCPGDAISPAKSHVTDEDEDDLITFGFYVSLGIGFFVGFWGVCGTLVIKTSWRHVYFKFFKNVNDWINVTIADFVNRLKNRFQAKTISINR